MLFVHVCSERYYVLPSFSPLGVWYSKMVRSSTSMNDSNTYPSPSCCDTTISLDGHDKIECLYKYSAQGMLIF